MKTKNILVLTSFIIGLFFKAAFAMEENSEASTPFDFDSNQFDLDYNPVDERFNPTKTTSAQAEECSPSQTSENFDPKAISEKPFQIHPIARLKDLPSDLQELATELTSPEEIRKFIRIYASNRNEIPGKLKQYFPYATYMQNAKSLLRLGLLATGTSVNVKNSDGQTALHLYARCNTQSNLFPLKKFIDFTKGLTPELDFNELDDNDKTPLDLATYDGIQKELVSHGGKKSTQIKQIAQEAQQNSSSSSSTAATAAAAAQVLQPPVPTTEPTEPEKPFQIQPDAHVKDLPKVLQKCVKELTTPQKMRHFIWKFTTHRKKNPPELQQYFPDATYMQNAKNLFTLGLLATHTSVNVKNKNGQTALHLYALCNSTDNLYYFKKFIEFTDGFEPALDFNALDNNGKTPLDFVKDNNIKEMLLAHGAKTSTKTKQIAQEVQQNSSSSSSTTAAVAAPASQPRVAITDLAVPEKPFHIQSDAHIKDLPKILQKCAKQLTTPQKMRLFIRKFTTHRKMNSPELQQYFPDDTYMQNAKNLFRLGLLATHTSVNVKDKNGQTILHLYALCNSTDNLYYFKKFIEFTEGLTPKPDFKARDNNGKTPLDLATYEKIKEILIQHGAKTSAEIKQAAQETQPSSSSSSSSTSIVTNEVYGYPPTTKKAKFTTVTTDAEAVEATTAPQPTNPISMNIIADTSLHTAVLTGKTEEIRLHLKPETINARNNEGNTPLHIAAEMGNPEIVTMLFDAGADAFITNNSGQTAKDLALENGHKVIADLLECWINNTGKRKRMEL